MSTVSSAVAQRDQRPTVGSYIQQLRPEIQRALPKGLDADRVARLALTVIRTDEIACRKRGKPLQALIHCPPESFAGALLTAAALGLDVGVNGEAYLVAYKGECTLIIGYQGFAKLFWQHPLAQMLDAQAVHEHDHFEWELGLNPRLEHKPAKGDRGNVTHYYAVAGLTTGARVFAVLTAAEARLLRDGKTGSNGGIPDPMHWMERKTVLRQLVKMLPKSTALAHAVDADERTGSELLHAQTPALAAAPVDDAPDETNDAAEPGSLPELPGWES